MVMTESLIKKDKVWEELVVEGGCFAATWNSTYPREVHAQLQLGQQV